MDILYTTVPRDCHLADTLQKAPNGNCIWLRRDQGLIGCKAAGVITVILIHGTFDNILNIKTVKVANMFFNILTILGLYRFCGLVVVPGVKVSLVVPGYFELLL